jgi:hypothetical protein
VLDLPGKQANQSYRQEERTKRKKTERRMKRRKEKFRHTARMSMCLDSKPVGRP